MTTSPISDQTIIEVFADNPESVSSAYEQVAQLATNGIHPLIIIEVFHNYHKQPVPVVTERLIALGCKPYDDNPARDAVFFHRGYGTIYNEVLKTHDHLVIMKNI